MSLHWVGEKKHHTLNTFHHVAIVSRYNFIMLRIRREEIAPRLEMTPMIDVIFLLLTFFIYSLAMMISAQVLPVTLTTVTAGSAGGTTQPGQVQAITIDRQGSLFFNREPVDMSALNTRLRELSQRPDQPTVYLAMEAQGTTDRGPMLLQLIDQVRSAGINRFVIVGQKPAGAESSANP